VGQLARTVAQDRLAGVARGSRITLEDVVREELRPLLKAWLDTHLPPLVERIVREEIERVVARAR
jgi:cell pole-organizing protein PopZ